MSETVIFKTFDYEQGDEGGLMDFLVTVLNSAVGAAVSFKAEQPNPGGSPIEIPRTPVLTPNQVTGMGTRVLAGYKSKILVSYFPNGPVSQNFDLTFRAQFVPPAQTQSEAAAKRPVVMPVRD
jgi:hypothetical protein